ncbi:MAG: hypothetical protein CSYNP_02299 [Syntrophus sp. SKADARSKE-3]|nr:hypothetical protein [Syntrophus sp. SKADARSKE-3]
MKVAMATYRLLTILPGRMGLWIFRFAAWWITAGFFLFSPGRVAVGVKFYRTLFPERGHWYHLWCTRTQFHHFTQVFIDRSLLSQKDKITYTHEGWEYLEEAVAKKSGGILVMSHVGNWEAASRLLQDKSGHTPGMKLMLYLGEKHKEQLERKQKEDLVQNGVTIIAVEQDGGSPADIVEGIKFLRNGGLVSLTGDRLWRRDQRSIAVNFLGREAPIPETPFIFALLSGAPLFIFFTYRTGKYGYHFKVLPPQFVTAKDRGDRDDAIRRAAQFYADRLEEMVREQPFEWFHFEPFIEEKKGS